MQNIDHGQSAHARRSITGWSRQCVAESEALLRILDLSLPLAESSEFLIAKFSGDGQPDSLDAREGLRLRLALVNLLGPLNDLRCCSEHSSLQGETSILLNFYLQMISRSFEVRFSRIVGGNFRIANATRNSARYEKLQSLRDDLRTSLSAISSEAVGGGVYVSDQPVNADYRAAGNQTALKALAVIGVLFIVSSVAGTIWAQSTDIQSTLVCDNVGCHTDQQLLYMAVTAMEASAAGLLAAGVVWLLGALMVSRLLMSVSLRQVPSRGSNEFTIRPKEFTRWLVWLPACVILAASAAGILYLSDPASTPHSVCSSDAKCTISSNYEFVENLSFLTPGIIVAGLTCLLAGVLMRTFPRADSELFEIAEESRNPERRIDRSEYMRPR